MDALDPSIFPDHTADKMPHGGGQAQWTTDMMNARRDGILPVLGFKPVDVYDDGITESWKRTDRNGLVMYITYERAALARCEVTASWYYICGVGTPTTVTIDEKLWRAIMDRIDNSTLLTRYS